MNAVSAPEPVLVRCAVLSVPPRSGDVRMADGGGEDPRLYQPQVHGAMLACCILDDWPHFVAVKLHEFAAETWLPQPPEVVFPFFADAANLDAITPPWLDFKIITPPPIVMRSGTLIDYRLRLRGFPLRWRTRISAWEPPFRFVDEQLQGPYRLWVHEHTFVPSQGGTLARDHIRYAVPFDWLVHRWLVRPDIERIFAHRLGALECHFNVPANAAQASAPR